MKRQGIPGPLGLFRVEAQAEVLIHDVLERPAASSSLRRQLGGTSLLGRGDDFDLVFERREIPEVPGY